MLGRVCILAGIWFAAVICPMVSRGETPAARGYRLLTSTPLLSPDFDQETFDAVWRSWPEPLRRPAEIASVEERRRMAFSRYGLTPRPDDDGKPLQYVVDETGQWTMNCFACHGGKVAGRVIPGLPNSLLALQTLTEETRAVKPQLGKRLSRMDVGGALIPLGTSRGATNAVMFGVALMAFRTPELNVVRLRKIPQMVHHDMDAPAWWQFKKKERIYIDGFVEKGHRALMQFMLIPENGPDFFQQREQEFRDVYAYLQSLEPPKYPFSIDRRLAGVGEKAFHRVCAECHGTYHSDESGIAETYPGVIVPIDEVNTDPVRLHALSRRGRADYGRSWFGEHGKQHTLDDPGGYMAPPLDGVWATAPYFHNGSVPTLWHVLHPPLRPRVWTRTEDGYDQRKVGLQATAFEATPTDLLDPHARRTYFDTRQFGKSAAGHTFVNQLTEQEKQAVLEYLKTL